MLDSGRPSGLSGNCHSYSYDCCRSVSDVRKPSRVSTYGVSVESSNNSEPLPFLERELRLVDA